MKTEQVDKNVFIVDLLNKLTFGASDAATDNLLDDDLCICQTTPIKTFLRDESSILAGTRGTGKTAVFRLLRDNKLKFENPTNSNQLLIAIDDPIAYQTLQRLVEEKIAGSSTSKNLQFRLVWELFILNACLQKLDSDFTLPKELKSKIDEFRNSLSLTQEKLTIEKFLIVLLSNKKQVGIKLSSDLVGNPVLDSYVSLTGSVEPEDAKTRSAIATLDIHLIKKSVQEFLASQNTNLYVLIDRLDDFVVGQDYDTQRRSLQGLLSVESSYSSSHIRKVRLKLFLRADLYKKLNIAELGADKIESRLVRLNWSDADVRNFISRRILWNYRQYASNLEHEVYSAMKQDEYLDEYDKELFRRKFPESKWGGLKLAINKIVEFLRLKPKEIYYDERIAFNYGFIVNNILESFFGHEVQHLELQGTHASMPIVNYLSTHFQLNTGETTPRMMLVYLLKCKSSAIEFYSNNYVIQGKSNFPIIPRKAICTAYNAFKEYLWHVVEIDAQSMGGQIILLRKKVKNIFSFNEVMAACNVGEQKALEIIAVMMHLGLINISNSADIPIKRTYEFALLFKEPGHIFVEK